jgi:hypothetical protein
MVGSDARSREVGLSGDWGERRKIPFTTATWGRRRPRPFRTCMHLQELGRTLAAFTLGATETDHGKFQWLALP